MALTVFANRLDQRAIDRAFSTRFAIAWGHLDQDNAQIIDRGTVAISSAETLRAVREKFLLRLFPYARRQ